MLDPDTGAITDIETPYPAFAPDVPADGYSTGCAAARPRSLACVLVIDLVQDHRVMHVEPDTIAYLAYPPTAEFVDDSGETIHAFTYPPSNPTCQGPNSVPPPYDVWVHSGSTGHDIGVFDLCKAYTTSRGIGALDVNYNVSNGCGRAYNWLRKSWGVVDVANAMSPAWPLIMAGRAAGDRLAI